MSTSGNLFSSAWQTFKDTLTGRYDPTHGIGSANGKPGLEGGVEYTDGTYEKFPTHPVVAAVVAPIGLAETAIKVTAGAVAAGLEAAAGDGKAPEANTPPSYSNSVTPEESAALEAKLAAGNPEKKPQAMTVPAQSAAEKEAARKEAGTPDYTVAV
jgi:hypothetical protein